MCYILDIGLRIFVQPEVIIGYQMLIFFPMNYFMKVKYDSIILFTMIVIDFL